MTLAPKPSGPQMYTSRTARSGTSRRSTWASKRTLRREPTISIEPAAAPLDQGSDLVPVDEVVDG